MKKYNINNIAVAKGLIFAVLTIGIVFMLNDKALAYNINENLQRVDSALVITWRRILELANLAVLLMLITVGFATIFHIQIDTYHIKKSIMPIIVGIILANFSLMITKSFLDISNIATVNMKNSIIATQERKGTGDNVAQVLSDVLIRHNWLQSFQNQGWVQNGIVSLTGLGVLGFIITGGWTSVFILAIVFFILLLLPAIAIWVLGVLFYARTWMLFFLITISPLAFLGVSWGPTQALFKRWWNQFLLWTFMVPIAYFFFWLAVTFNESIKQTGAFNLGSYIAGLVLFWLAVVAPFKLGGAVGALLGGTLKKFGAAVGGWGTGVAWGKYNRKMEARYRTKDPEKWFGKIPLDSRLGKAIGFARKISAPKMPSWRVIKERAKVARERAEQESMSEPGADFQQWYETWITRGHLGPQSGEKQDQENSWLARVGSRFIEKGQSTAADEAWEDRINELTKRYPNIEENQIVQAIERGDSDDDIAAMVNAYIASNYGRLPNDKIMSHLEKTLPEHRYKNLRKRASSNGGVKFTGIHNDDLYGIARKQVTDNRTVFQGTENEDVMLYEKQVKKAMKLLNEIKEETGRNGEYKYNETIRGRAAAELAYYGENPEKAHKSLLLGELRNELTEKDQQLADDLGLSYGYQKALKDFIGTPKNAEDVFNRGTGAQAMLSSLARMFQFNPNALEGSQARDAARQMAAYQGQKKQIQAELSSLNLSLPKEPAHETFNINADTEISNDLKMQVKSLLTSDGNFENFKSKLGDSQYESADTAKIAEAVEKLQTNKPFHTASLQEYPNILEDIQDQLKTGKELTKEDIKEIFKKNNLNTTNISVSHLATSIEQLLRDREDLFNSANQVLSKMKEDKKTVKETITPRR